MSSAAPKQFIPVVEEIRCEKTTESKISRVIALLPSSLQPRIDPFQTIRRSMSLGQLKSSNFACEDSGRPRPLSEADATSLVKAHGVSGSGYQGQFQELSRTGSGIHYRFARQGTSLVATSIEGRDLATREEDRAFERKAFIDGLTYLLKGIPQDLDSREIDQIRNAIPPEVSLHSTTEQGLKHGSSQPRSIIQRAVQIAVVQIVLLLSFVLPYLMQILRFAVSIERKHRLSERLLEQGVNIAMIFGGQAAFVIETMCGLTDGTVGRSLTQAVGETIHSIAQGIRDGVGEALDTQKQKPRG